MNSYNIDSQVAIKPQIERYYQFVTTNQINTGTGVNGTQNNFTVNIQPLILDASKHFTVEVISFYYRNVNTPAGIFPIILTDISQNVGVNNIDSSILYRSNQPTGNVNYITSDVTNNVNIVRPVKRNIINSIQVQIVRSDNGQPFDFAPAEPIDIVFLFKSELTLFA